jgi:pimeloyl-ACP methyl ester carboxylesterase
LLPGALGRGVTSFEYIEALGVMYRVLAPDYPLPARSLADLADGASTLLRACGVERAHVVGGSFGGMVAQALAARRPEQVASLVLTDTTGPCQRRAPVVRLLTAVTRAAPGRVLRVGLALGVRRYLRPVPHRDRVFWQSHFDDTLATLDKACIVSLARCWTEFDERYAIPAAVNFAGPVQIVTASDDRFVTPGVQRALLRRYPHAGTATIGTGGHAASLTNAAGYLAAIRAFLTDVYA